MRRPFLEHVDQIDALEMIRSKMSLEDAPIESLNSIFALALTPLRYAGTDLLKCSNPPGMATTKRTNQTLPNNDSVANKLFRVIFYMTNTGAQAPIRCATRAHVVIALSSELWPKNAFGIAFVQRYACFGFESQLAVLVANSFCFLIQKIKTQNVENDTWPPMPLENTTRIFEWMRTVFIFIRHFSSEVYIFINWIFRTACKTRIWWLPINLSLFRWILVPHVNFRFYDWFPSTRLFHKNTGWADWIHRRWTQKFIHKIERFFFISRASTRNAYEIEIKSNKIEIIIDMKLLCGRHLT